MAPILNHKIVQIEGFEDLQIPGAVCVMNSNKVGLLYDLEVTNASKDMKNKSIVLALFIPLGYPSKKLNF